MYAYRQQEPVQYRKRYVCQRATKIQEQLQDITLYAKQSEDKRPLRNLLVDDSTLDSKSIDDLLTIEVQGIQRMNGYIENTFLVPTTEKRKKSTQEN